MAWKRLIGRFDCDKFNNVILYKLKKTLKMNTIKNSLLKLYTKIGSSSIFNFFINNITKKFCKESI